MSRLTILTVILSAFFAAFGCSPNASSIPKSLAELHGESPANGPDNSGGGTYNDTTDTKLQISVVNDDPDTILKNPEYENAVQLSMDSNRSGIHSSEFVDFLVSGSRQFSFNFTPSRLTVVLKPSLSGKEKEDATQALVSSSSSCALKAKFDKKWTFSLGAGESCMNYRKQIVEMIVVPASAGDNAKIQN